MRQVACFAMIFHVFRPISCGKSSPSCVEIMRNMYAQSFFGMKRTVLPFQRLTTIHALAPPSASLDHERDISEVSNGLSRTAAKSMQQGGKTILAARLDSPRLSRVLYNKV